MFQSPQTMHKGIIDCNGGGQRRRRQVHRSNEDVTAATGIGTPGTGPAAAPSKTLGTEAAPHRPPVRHTAVDDRVSRDRPPSQFPLNDGDIQINFRSFSAIADANFSAVFSVADTAAVDNSVQLRLSQWLVRSLGRRTSGTLISLRVTLVTKTEGDIALWKRKNTTADIIARRGSVI